MRPCSPGALAAGLPSRTEHWWRGALAAWSPGRLERWPPALVAWSPGRLATPGLVQLAAGVAGRLAWRADPLLASG